MKWMAGFILLVGAMPLCFADKQAVEQSHYQYSSEQQSKIRNTDAKEYEVWGLTRQDWTSYQILMQGHRGILSPNLDPITALGVEANTQEERHRFAKIHVRFEKQRVEKELAFQRAVDQAWTRFYPKAQLIDMNKIEQGQVATTGQKVEQVKGRLLFFTTVKTCSDCDNALSALLEQVDKGRQLDIFIESAKSDAQIREWAKVHAIPLLQVRSRNITLNHDKGKLAMISQFTGQVPYVAVKVGNNRYQQIELP
jgi:integrating conjugative element protein (TIGR03759 family)